jgi:hypothetical protein
MASYLAAAKDAAKGRADSLRTGASTLTEAAKDAARNRAEQAGVAIARAKEAYSKGELGDALSGVVKANVDIQSYAEAGYGLVGEKLAKRKMDAKVGLISMAKPVRAKMLLAIREALKSSAVADPDMWKCCSRRIQDGIDCFWDDLTVYIETMEEDSKDAIKKRTHEEKELAEIGEKACCCSPRWWRNQVLYHYLPFDLSVFGQFKDIWFWVLTALSLMTMYGIRIAFHAVLLLMIVTGCPGDEYQMVMYILAFKGTQFISSGVVMAIMAAIKYYLCVKIDGTHTCATEGPGVNVDTTTSAIDFFGCCILVWLAFFCLPACKRSAGLKEIVPDDKEKEAAPGRNCCGAGWNPERGGRMTGLLGYDFVCFLLSCGLLVVLTYVETMQHKHSKKIGLDELQEETTKWEFKTAIFWARIFYSLLAFPFTLFMIPGLNSILTHTSPTGYNRQGVCVPFLLRPMEEEEPLE